MTTLQRREVYHYLLFALQLQEGTMAYSFGICRILHTADYYITISEWYPELQAQKPKRADIYGYWAPLDKSGNAQRIKWVLNAIEATYK